MPRRPRSRKEFSDRVKRDRWDHARCITAIDGDHSTSNCEQCGVLLLAADRKHHFDHHMPDGLAGPPTFENCRVLCAACHGIKTRRDTAMMVKADAQRARHIGGKKKPKGRPLPGTKASGWRKRMDGTVERRD